MNHGELTPVLEGVHSLFEEEKEEIKEEGKEKKLEEEDKFDQNQENEKLLKAGYNKNYSTSNKTFTEGDRENKSLLSQVGDKKNIKEDEPINNGNASGGCKLCISKLIFESKCGKRLFPQCKVEL